MQKRIQENFFSQNTLQAAQDLIGCQIIWHNHKGVIIETEAYIGEDDPACHASCGKTKRNAIMYEEPGLCYVYMIYGMYYCLNIVTEKVGFPAAILLRGIKIDDIHVNGPGKLCQHLGITTADSGVNLCSSNQHQIFSPEKRNPKIIATPRIGISKGKEKLWRFVTDV